MSPFFIVHGWMPSGQTAREWVGAENRQHRAGDRPPGAMLLAVLGDVSGGDSEFEWRLPVFIQDETRARAAGHTQLSARRSCRVTFVSESAPDPSAQRN